MSNVRTVQDMRRDLASQVMGWKVQWFNHERHMAEAWFDKRGFRKCDLHEWRPDEDASQAIWLLHQATQSGEHTFKGEITFSLGMAMTTVKGNANEFGAGAAENEGDGYMSPVAPERAFCRAITEAVAQAYGIEWSACETEK